MWAADAPEEDDDWIFHEEGPEFSQQTEKWVDVGGALSVL